MMFEKSEYLERLAKVKKSMAEKGIDVLMVTNPANMCYLMGHNAWSFYVHQMVVVSMDEEIPYFIGRYMDAFSGVAKLTYLDKEHVFAYPDYYVQSTECHPMEYMADVLKQLGLDKKTIGVEMDAYYFTAKAYERLVACLPDAKIVDGDKIVNWVKIIKSDAEIEMIRKAGIVANAAMDAGINAIHAGARQCDVAAAIIQAQAAGTAEVGGDYAAIMPLLPYGEYAGAPHLTWNEDKYPNDTCLFIEIAGAHQRYHCPMSRTVAIGKPNDDVKRVVDITIEGLTNALETIKPGNTCEMVEKAWRDTAAKYGIEKESRIGYSTGLNYPPDWGEHTASVRPGDKTILQPNMVFHIIPGMYFDDYGASISQCVRVTETGYEKMNVYPYDLVTR